jgi:hypothetical protein
VSRLRSRRPERHRRRRVEHGGMGPEAVRQTVAEPGAGVDVGSFFLSCLFFVFMTWRNGQVNWTSAERLYLSDYRMSGAWAKPPAAMVRDTLLEGLTAQGRAGACYWRRNRGCNVPGRALRGRANRPGNQGWTDAVAVDDGQCSTTVSSLS